MGYIMGMSQDDNKQCPFCAETIKKAAVICRFCNRDMPPPEALSLNDITRNSINRRKTSAVLGIASKMHEDGLGSYHNAPTNKPSFLGLSLLLVFSVLVTFAVVGQTLVGNSQNPGPVGIEQSQETKARRAQLCRERLADCRDAILNHDWRKAKEHLGVALAHAEESGDPGLLAKVRQIQQNLQAQGYAP